MVHHIDRFWGVEVWCLEGRCFLKSLLVLISGYRVYISWISGSWNTLNIFHNLCTGLLLGSRMVESTCVLISVTFICQEELADCIMNGFPVEHQIFQD